MSRGIAGCIWRGTTGTIKSIKSTTGIMAEVTTMTMVMTVVADVISIPAA
jgi:hypothetical protein